MELPRDTKLPFFAYGIFKPRQLGFFRICDFVSDCQETTVRGRLKERDAIPLLIEGDSFDIKGVLLYFDHDYQTEAYKAIGDIEPQKVYRWSVITTTAGIRANVLLGKKPDRGSFELEDMTEWDGKSDPFFSIAIDEVESILNDNRDKPLRGKDGWDYKPVLRLQMAYALLWTALERYAGLRYYLGKEPLMKNKIDKISEEPVFRESLKKYVKREERVLDSADPEKKCILDPENPLSSIRYYYQVRSNAVHRGKAVFNDFGILRNSLQELLAIFKDLLNHAWSLGINGRKTQVLRE